MKHLENWGRYSQEDALFHPFVADAIGVLL